MLVWVNQLVFSTNASAGNASLAGGLAALLANVVLISYVVVAMREDESGQPTKLDPKKNQ